MKKKHIVITGGSGLLGRELRNSVHFKDYEISIFTRTPKGEGEYLMDIQTNVLDATPLTDNPFILIHLAGANVASKRWTPNFKREMYESRLKPLDMVYSTCDQLHHFPDFVLSGSATGYYPNGIQEIQNEASDCGAGFLADLCFQWEQAVLPFQRKNIPVCIMRTGVVMSKKGGFIPSFQKPVRWGIGAVIGDGHYRMPWIYIEDWIRAVKFIIENKNIVGAVNMCATEPVTNKYITKLMAKMNNRKIILPAVPPFIIRFLLGEFSEELFSDKHIYPQKLIENGFDFIYPNIDSAMLEIYKRSKE